jgi:uncharacterized membrane protein AbrB (regulator of aidB expression)
VLAYALGWVLCTLEHDSQCSRRVGLGPGGASAMLILAEAQGADVRLVAFMQYLRVVCVSLTASLVALSQRPAVTWAPTRELDTGVRLGMPLSSDAPFG